MLMMMMMLLLLGYCSIQLVEVGVVAEVLRWSRWRWSYEDDDIKMLEKIFIPFFILKLATNT